MPQKREATRMAGNLLGPKIPDRCWALGIDRLAPDELDRWTGRVPLLLRRSGYTVGCELRYLDDADLEDLLALQHRITATLPDGSLFRPVPPERHALYLRQRGRSAGAFRDGKLVAYACVQFPVPWDENQGRDLGLARESLDRICQMEGIGVDPAYRGHAIARSLNEMRLIYARNAGYTSAIATISPFNRYSLASFVPTGLLVKGLRRGEGSLLRYFVHDDMECDAVPLDGRWLAVETHDLETQDALLARGWWGFRPDWDGARLRMLYARFALRRRAAGTGTRGTVDTSGIGRRFPDGAANGNPGAGSSSGPGAGSRRLSSSSAGPDGQHSGRG